MRLAAFVIALCLLGGSIDPTRGWLIALVVVTGLSAIRPRFWNWLHVRPAIDIRLAAFVLSVLLLAGVVDPTRDWLIALSVVTGLAAFMPRLIGFGGERDCGHWWNADRWEVPSRRWSARIDRDWERWERRMDRRMNRHSRGWNEDWS